MHLQHQRQLETIKEEDERAINEREILEEQKDEEVKLLDQMNREKPDLRPNHDQFPA